MTDQRLPQRVNQQDEPIAAPAITELDSETVDRIAAGEVVERPASVAKELLENSLDAGAERISVTVEDAGKALIRVSDDGVGMTRDAVLKAIDRHTTSKLRSIADLEAGIETLGFRGEALHTIAAVSRMTIETRPHGGSSSGTIVTIEGGTVTDVAPTGCPPGTTIRVADLFYNTPARKSFLRSSTTEFDHINRMVANYALANPSVAIALTHDDREIFSAPGRGDLRGTVGAVYSHDVASAMIDIQSSDTEGPLSTISGLVSDPETTRSRPRYLSTFINGRYVRSGALRDAVIEAYGGQLAADRYPFAVLFCAIPPDEIDVNVHPRKLEVRFESTDAVKSQLSEVVRSSLLEHGLIRTTAPRGRGTPEETVLDVDSTAGDSARGGSSSPVTPNPPRSTASTDRSKQATPNTSASIRARPEQETVDGSTGTPAFDQLPSLDILGQLDETFIVAQFNDGLLLIDQHAADERIHFERLQEQFTTDATRQSLVTPVTLSVTADEAAAFDRVREALDAVGFTAELLDDQTIEVRAVPAVIDTTVNPDRLRDAIASAIETAAASNAIEAAADAIIGDLACYPAVTGHTALTDGSMVSLLETLDACENPYACPHGRPVLIRIDYAELRDRFERDYPGHVDRREERDR